MFLKHTCSLVLCAVVLAGCTATNERTAGQSMGAGKESIKEPRCTVINRAVINEATDARCAPTATAFNCVNIVEIYDGDSFFIDIPGSHPLFGRRIGVRILGVDTPELRSANACEKERAMQARSALRSMLLAAERVDIIDVQRDKYFRILGVVLADGRSVADELIKRKLAYPYHGEKKPVRNWCM